MSCAEFLARLRIRNLNSAFNIIKVGKADLKDQRITFFFVVNLIGVELINESKNWLFLTVYKLSPDNSNHNGNNFNELCFQLSCNSTRTSVIFPLIPFICRCTALGGLHS